MRRGPAYVSCEMERRVTMRAWWRRKVGRGDRSNVSRRFNRDHSRVNSDDIAVMLVHGRDARFAHHLYDRAK